MSGGRVSLLGFSCDELAVIAGQWEGSAGPCWTHAPQAALVSQAAEETVVRLYAAHNDTSGTVPEMLIEL